MLRLVHWSRRVYHSHLFVAVVIGESVLTRPRTISFILSPSQSVVVPVSFSTPVFSSFHFLPQSTKQMLSLRIAKYNIEPHLQQGSRPVPADQHRTQGLVSSTRM